jgi:small subunit ribosomal protein S8
MSMQDPIADMLTRIRNASSRKHKSVSMPFSKHKVEILKVLKSAGYISSFAVSEEVKRNITVMLKYHDDSAVIKVLKRVSKSSRRIYMSSCDLAKSIYKDGFGTAIVSTPLGVMTDNDAIKKGVGGEVLLYVSI